MPFRKIASILLAVIVIAGGGIGWHHSVARAAAPRSSVPVGKAAAVTPVRRATARAVQHSESVRWVWPTAQVLPADQAALLAEMSDLKQAAQDSGLELDPEQWEALAAVTLEAEAVRHAYEATIATTTVMAPGRYRVEIPLYPAAGDALREQFQAKLREQLGERSAAAVLTQLGTQLEGRFGGFGVSVQTLDVVGEAAAANPDWEVTRTVKYWNSVEGQNRLTTRRETFLPRREDPLGQSWGPLLSALSEQTSSAAGS